MSILILTRYHGPGNVKGARVSAVIPARGIRVTVPYGDPQDRDEPYERAARAALDKWQGSRAKPAPMSGLLSILKDPNEPDRLLAVEYDKRGPAFIAGVWS